MNFLELCRTFREEAAMSGTGPTSVLNQTGQMKQVVDWINRAYQHIQNDQIHWSFMRRPFSFDTIAGEQIYTADAIGLTDFGEWAMNKFRITPDNSSSEQYMIPVTWDYFDNAFRIGTTRTSQGYPVYVAQQPDMALTFWPIPSDVFTVYGEYFIKAQQMSANTDEPIFPARFHMAIVWKALMYYANYYAADERYVFAENEYRKLMHEMKRSQLPLATLGETMA